jgi:hypothetical protein
MNLLRTEYASERFKSCIIKMLPVQEISFFYNWRHLKSQIWEGYPKTSSNFKSWSNTSTFIIRSNKSTADNGNDVQHWWYRVYHYLKPV